MDVVHKLHHLGESFHISKIATLFEVESLMNDGSGVILYFIFFKLSQTSGKYVLDGEFIWENVFVMFFGGLMIGFLVWLFATWWLR